MKSDHRVLWSGLPIACLVLTALTFSASGKLRSLTPKDPSLTSPLCRNGYRLIQQQQEDPRDRCLLNAGPNANPSRLNYARNR